MGGRGRPVFSQIRRNIIELLFFKEKAYGYEIYHLYINIFPKVTMRSIYYHLKKGLDLGEFAIDKIEKEKGEYSWGEYAEKIYYALGPNAHPRGDQNVKEYIQNGN